MAGLKTFRICDFSYENPFNPTHDIYLLSYPYSYWLLDASPIFTAYMRVQPANHFRLLCYAVLKALFFLLPWVHFVPPMQAEHQAMLDA